MSNARIVRANGVDLCVETLGDHADPAVLLISGSEASMDWWEADLCTGLAAGLRFVIRYDHRDTARLVTYEPRTADDEPYSDSSASGGSASS